MADPTAAADRSTEIDARSAFRLSLWFGLMTGIGSATLIGVQKFVLDAVTISSPQKVESRPRRKPRAQSRSCAGTSSGASPGCVRVYV